MTLRGAAAVVVCLAVLGVAGCGSNGEDDGSDSPMDRCRGGRTMTVTDPAGDGLRGAPVVSDWRNAVAAKPGAFDIERVRIATTNTMLCASVTFAQSDPKREPGGATLRVIRLDLAPARPRPRDTDGPLAHLEYGRYDNVATWVGNGSVTSDESDGDFEGEQIHGVREREVQLAVPVGKLFDVAGRPTARSPANRLDPRSFSWRISVVSDCVPGARELITFPSVGRIDLRSDTDSNLSEYCR